MPKSIDPYEVLERYVQGFENRARAAESLEISQPYLHDLLNKRREFSDRMLEKLGLQYVVVKQEK